MDQAQDGTDTATFTCLATGEPVPTISWYLNDVPVDVTDATKYTVSMTSFNVTTNSSRLTIMSVQSSDVGTYTCNATNVVSSGTSSGVLTVIGKNLSFFLLSIVWVIILNFYFIIIIQYRGHKGYGFLSQTSNLKLNINFTL